MVNRVRKPNVIHTTMNTTSHHQNLDAIRKIPPYQRQGSPHTSTESSQTACDSFESISLKICLVEADAKRASNIKTILSNYGHVTHSVNVPSRVLSTLNQYNFDLLLVADLNLPKSILIKAIRRSKYTNISAIPILVLSYDETLHKDILLLDHGADDVLPYSTNMKELNSCMVSVCDQCKHNEDNQGLHVANDALQSTARRSPNSAQSLPKIRLKENRSQPKQARTQLPLQKMQITLPQKKQQEMKDASAEPAESTADKSSKAAHDPLLQFFVKLKKFADDLHT